MKLPFDKCYCLHLTEATERYKNIKNEFERLGISEQIEIWWTVIRPISNEIGNYLTSLHTQGYDDWTTQFNKNTYGAIFNISFEFYTIIKQAYLRGFNSILLMEDDLKFNDDIDLEKIFSNLPDDWDVIRFGYHPKHNKLMENDIDYINAEKYDLLKKEWAFPTNNMFALNRKGMEFYINYMDEKFEVADYPLKYMFEPENQKFNKDGKPIKQYVCKTSIISVDNFYTSILKYS